MPMTTADSSSLDAHLPLDQVLTRAVEHFRAARLGEAESLCQRILAAAPRHAPTLHLYGIIAYRVGALPAAIDLLRLAVAVDGNVAHYHADLGEISRLNGDLELAHISARRALELTPDDPQALHNLGVVQYARGEFGEAQASFERAIALQPAFADAHCNLGNALRALGKLEEAVVAYRQALVIKPDYAAAFNNLGTVLRELDRLEEAQ
ncbi:MAG: tetratricopeptide repeat protein, partial [Hyphomicrobiales bacterium]|nr:tetratricopeptide repeat protein [Hyphomicrobiales bacterium]